MKRILTQTTREANMEAHELAKFMSKLQNDEVLLFSPFINLRPIVLAFLFNFFNVSCCNFTEGDLETSLSSFAYFGDDNPIDARPTLVAR